MVPLPFPYDGCGFTLPPKPWTMEFFEMVKTLLILEPLEVGANLVFLRNISLCHFLEREVVLLYSREINFKRILNMILFGGYTLW